MNNFEDKRAQFRQRLDALAGQEPQEEVEAVFSPQEVDRLSAWQALLEGHQAAFSSREAPRQAASLQGGLDDAFLVDLQLNDLSRPAWFARPVQAGVGENGLRDALAKFGLTVPDRFTLPPAMHLPGVGTFLVSDPNMEEDPARRAELLGQAAWARWGWGFLLEYTSLGQAAGAAGLWPALTALFMGLPYENADKLTLAASLRRTWLLAESGWLEWAWTYAMFRGRHAPGRGLIDSPKSGRMVELVVLISRLFPLYLTPFGVRVYFRNLVGLVRFLFLEQGEVIPKTLNAVLAETEAFCLAHDAAVQEKTGRSLSAVLGGFYTARLESAVGITALPHAMRIAFDLPDLLKDSDGDPARLLELAAEDPRQRVDTRLAMLSALDPRVKYDPAAMKVAAWERLGM